jgi:DNA primase
MEYQRLLEDADIDLKIHNQERSQALLLCPFHAESNPSCSVNLESGIFICFSCGESGNFTKLYAEVCGVDIEEAGKLLDGEFDIDMLISRAHKKIDRELVEQKTKHIVQRAFYKKYPALIDRHKRYLHKRKINNSTMVAFDLRSGNKNFKWDNRIIIPIYNDMCQMIGFSGRSILKDIQPKNRKFVAYDKALRSVLFGLNQFSKSILPYLILVEGEFDAMYLQQLGYNAVALMNSLLLSKKQIALLIKHTKKVIISLDNDEAGKRASRKIMDQLRKYITAEIIQVKYAKDANEETEINLRNLFKNLEQNHILTV